MQNLWAPWRKELIRKLPLQSCFFCDYIKENQDEKNLVLDRRECGIVLMNYYPYNGGHLLVAPYEHIGQLSDLSPKVRAALMEYIVEWQKVLSSLMKPEGFNIGLNQGKVAGAGMGEHLHWHIIPRWNGDTSFVSIVGDIKVVNQALEDLYKELKEKKRQLSPSS